jgi:hypothetical protein
MMLESNGYGVRGMLMMLESNACIRICKRNTLRRLIDYDLCLLRVVVVVMVIDISWTR